MALPQPDPSLPGGAAPVFGDTDAARGDHLRANNQAIWENLEYLNDGENINDASAATPVDADRVGFFQIAGAIIKYVTWSEIKSLIITAAQAAFANLFVKPGTYIQFAGPSAPAGYLACDGSAVSRTTYADLFAVISTIYGVGDGSTTFNLPDARGLVMVGAGSHGTMTRANGTPYNGGTVGATRNDQMQGHWHQVDKGDLFVAASSATRSAFMGDTATGLAASDHIRAKSFVSDGTNGTPRVGDETRPAEIAVLVCIKY